jgi:hypothetical protein
MAYYIFLKSLRSLEEFRKNPHVKIPPKSPSTNFQSLGKFKNPIFNSEISFSLSPRLSSVLAERHCLLTLHHRRPASTAPPEFWWGPSWAPHALLSLLCLRRWALAHRSGRRLSSGERAAVPWPPHCPRCHRSIVDRARSAGPRRRGPGPRIYPLKNNSWPKFPLHFATKPLCFSKINPRSSFVDFANKPLYFSKINPQSMIFQLSPKFEKYLQKGP